VCVYYNIRFSIKSKDKVVSLCRVSLFAVYIVCIESCPKLASEGNFYRHIYVSCFFANLNAIDWLIANWGTAHRNGFYFPILVFSLKLRWSRYCAEVKRGWGLKIPSPIFWILMIFIPLKIQIMYIGLHGALWFPVLFAFCTGLAPSVECQTQVRTVGKLFPKLFPLECLAWYSPKFEKHRKAYTVWTPIMNTVSYEIHHIAFPSRHLHLKKCEWGADNLGC